MMELGATVCTPKSPRCEECPVSRWCRARKLGIAEEIPDGAQETRHGGVTLAAAVLLDPHGRTLLLRQQNGDGALVFAHVAIPRAGNHGATRPPNLRSICAREFGITVNGQSCPSQPPAHRDLPQYSRRAVPDSRGSVCRAWQGARTVDLASQLGDLPISNATRKIAGTPQSGMRLQIVPCSHLDEARSVFDLTPRTGISAKTRLGMKTGSRSLLAIRADSCIALPDRPHASLPGPRGC